MVVNYVKVHFLSKVKIAESLDDEELRLIDDGRKTKLGHPSTRQSWHGQSPTRFSSRFPERTKSATSRNESLRYSHPSRSEQPLQFQREVQVHGKVVAVKDQHRLNSHWSIGNLRPSSSEGLRLLSENTHINRPHEHTCGNFISNAEANRNRDQIGRNIGRPRTSAMGNTKESRRAPPDYFTAIKRSKGKVTLRNFQFCSLSKLSLQTFIN